LKKLTTLRTITILLALFILNSCQVNNSFSADKVKIVPVDNSKESQLNSKALKILSSKCINCHSSSIHKFWNEADNIDFFIQEGLVTPGNPENSDLYSYLEGYGKIGGMPENASALTKEEAQIIKEWILQSSKQPQPKPGPVPKPKPQPEPDDPTDSKPQPDGPQKRFEAAVKVLLKESADSKGRMNSCFSCHADGDEFPIDLDSNQSLENEKIIIAIGWVTPGNAEDSLLYDRLEGFGEEGGMPRKRPQLSDEDAKTVQDWINGINQ